VSGAKAEFRLIVKFAHCDLLLVAPLEGWAAFSCVADEEPSRQRDGRYISHGFYAHVPAATYDLRSSDPQRAGPDQAAVGSPGRAPHSGNREHQWSVTPRLPHIHLIVADSLRVYVAVMRFVLVVDAGLSIWFVACAVTGLFVRQLQMLPELLRLFLIRYMCARAPLAVTGQDRDSSKLVSETIAIYIGICWRILQVVCFP
jgi:hypothetical protein